ncbi:MAG: ABC transporter permease [Clostridia bacterium]|nr:ABC transporter permease [Clostridia bacterium]
MRDSCRRIGLLTKRSLKEILRDPLSLIFTLGLPLVMEILFWLIFHGMTSQFGMKYLAPGIVVFSQSFLTLFVGILLATDRSTSFLTRLFVSRAQPFEFIFGYTLSILPLVLIQSVLFFIVGTAFEPSIFGIGILRAVLLSLVTSLFFIAAGLLLGTLCTEKSIGGVASILIAGQSVLSGMWFPVEGLSSGMLTAMKILPFRNATLLIQNALNGWSDGFGDILLPLLIVIAYAVAVFIIAILIFRSKMRSD